MKKIIELIDSIGSSPLQLKFDDGTTIEYQWLEKVDESIYNNDSLVVGLLLENPDASLAQFSVNKVTKIVNLTTGKVEYERFVSNT